MTTIQANHLPIEPESDTELAQNGIDFVSRLVARRSSVFLQETASPEAESFFLFALKVLDGREPLPKAAAAEFWVS